MTGDLNDFYLGIPMAEYEHKRIPIAMIPPAVMEYCDLQALIHNGCVYVEIEKACMAYLKL